MPLKEALFVRRPLRPFRRHFDYNYPVGCIGRLAPLTKEIRVAVPPLQDEQRSGVWSEQKRLGLWKAFHDSSIHCFRVYDRGDGESDTDEESDENDDKVSIDKGIMSTLKSQAKEILRKRPQLWKHLL